MAHTMLLLLCGGPLLVTAGVWVVASSLPTGSFGVLHVGGILLMLQLLAAAAVSMLYRWCFARPAVRGAALLSALIVSVLALSHQPILTLFATLAHGSTGSIVGIAPICLSLLIEGGKSVAIAASAGMICLLLCEVPLRWVQGDWGVISDGTFRALRAIGVALLFVICSSLAQERGMEALVRMLRRAIA
jgi:hypothetical protein